MLDSATKLSVIEIKSHSSNWLTEAGVKIVRWAARATPHVWSSGHRSNWLTEAGVKIVRRAARATPHVWSSGSKDLEAGSTCHTPCVVIGVGFAVTTGAEGKRP
ncbi:hypothetical protein LSAT2_027181 [Lamellibrachia satsuma]|nr:hypothetical protein LSAT2_027181 [Lamellibrachia satsuma]